MTRARMIWTYAFVLLTGSGAGMACSSNVEDTPLDGAQVAVLGDFDRCGDERLDDLALACSASSGQAVAISAGQLLTHDTLHSVQLADNGSGQ